MVSFSFGSIMERVKQRFNYVRYSSLKAMDEDLEADNFEGREFLHSAEVYDGDEGLFMSTCFI